jgi:hypothetical protein
MRVRNCSISPELLLSLFTTGPHKGGYSVVQDAIPENAILLNVRHGWPNTIDLLIESAEFSDIQDGQVIPELAPLCVFDFSEQTGQA